MGTIIREGSEGIVVTSLSDCEVTVLQKISVTFCPYISKTLCHFLGNLHTCTDRQFDIGTYTTGVLCRHKLALQTDNLHGGYTEKEEDDTANNNSPTMTNCPLDTTFVPLIQLIKASLDRRVYLVEESTLLLLQFEHKRTKHRSEGKG